MEVFGCVHLFVGQGDFDEWCSALNRHGWHSLVYGCHDQLRQLVSPDLQECIVVDLDFVPLETVARHAKDPTASPILAIADPSRLDSAIESVRCGAWDVLLKPVAVDQLVKKIAAALERDRQTRTSDHDWRARCQALSPREREVMLLLLDACNTAQIAHRLGISTKTAEKHRLHVLEKLNVQSVAELLRMAFRPRCHTASLSHVSDASQDQEAVSAEEEPHPAPIPHSSELLLEGVTNVS